jgi:hypothetical protein
LADFLREAPLDFLREVPQTADTSQHIEPAEGHDCAEQQEVASPTASRADALSPVQEEAVNYESDTLQRYRKSLVISDLHRAIAQTAAAIQESEPTESYGHKEGQEGALAGTAEDDSQSCIQEETVNYETAKLQGFRKSLFLSDLRQEVQHTADTSQHIKPAEGHDCAEEQEVASPVASKANLQPTVQEEAVNYESDKLQGFRKSLVLADLHRAIAQTAAAIQDPVPTESYGHKEGQEGALAGTAEDDSQSCIQEETVSDEADALQRTRKSLLVSHLQRTVPQTVDTSQEMGPNDCKERSEQEVELAITTSAGSQPCMQEKTVNNENDMWVTQKSLVMSDLAERVKSLYRGDRHCTETSGRAGLDPPSQSKPPAADNGSQQRDTVMSEQRGTVMSELHVKVSSLNTDHHHVVFSPIAEEEKDISTEENFHFGEKIEVDDTNVEAEERPTLIVEEDNVRSRDRGSSATHRRRRGRHSN